MTVRYYSETSDGFCEHIGSAENAKDCAILERDGEWDESMEGNGAGVLIQTLSVYRGDAASGFGNYVAFSEPIDPFPQIREAFPAIARRLDALDAVERLLESTMRVTQGGRPPVEREALTIIWESRK